MNIVYFQLRVIGGPNKRLGRLEVFSNGNWEGICGMEFGPREAEVACRQAGLGYAVRGFSTSKYGNRKTFNQSIVNFTKFIFNIF